MTRPVHYAAHGSGGLAFACYNDEIRLWLGSEYHVPNKYGGRDMKFRYPRPRRSTDLRNVTCPKCWFEIRKLVLKQRIADHVKGGA